MFLGNVSGDDQSPPELVFEVFLRSNAYSPAICAKTCLIAASHRRGGRRGGVRSASAATAERGWTTAVVTITSARGGAMASTWAGAQQ